MPSTASKVTLLVSSLITGGIVYYVHFKQYDERLQLHKGIEIEEERQAQKRQNLERLQQQAEIEKAYRQSGRN